jgi:hypothetical protein
MIAIKNPEVFYKLGVFLLFMYDFAVQFSPEGLSKHVQLSFSFYVKVSLN